MTTYLGIDIGTSAVKVLLVDSHGDVLDSHSESYGIDSPQPLWNEQNPDVWWQATVNSLKALQAVNESAWRQVAAIGLSGQMHGAVCLDDQGQPLRPAILWNDGRAFQESATLNRLCPNIGHTAGVPAMPGFTAPKLLWLHEHEPDVFRRIHKVILPKDYVRLKLTGTYCTDVSDAAGTVWLDEAKRDWDDDILQACHLTRVQMPTLIEGNGNSGTLLEDIANQLGLSTQVCVAGGAGDASAGGIGIGAINEGDAFLSLGTSGQIFVAKEQHLANPDAYIHAFAHALPNRWCHMACLLNGASPLQWFSTITSTPIATLLEEAESQHNIHDSVYFLPYLTGERTPHNNPFATGSFEGITGQTQRSDMTQAILEGIAFSFRDCLLALNSRHLSLTALGAIGGGAKSAFWLQILADVLNVPIHKYQGAETGPAMGAARLAILSHTQQDIESVCTPPPVEAIFLPDPDRHNIYVKKHVHFDRLYQALSPTYGHTSK
ncbi:xylulokinase [Enterovibrio norvegicus FF-33]|uniref:Xylulose kinase n=1 Tax=Enterovibrio norvegicus FF-454 TaxID=1185651 RepID=A0A1E5C8J1_9GAMM|nr:xylulokinase [Enterovibrio norvegicus]OEE61796.1 xylulokinase [Enterovibrio norvegicus FF-454]OEE66593.1 xylulokinase [Enterovibrio norvegicus FF-33]